MRMPLFTDRRDAGRRLAKQLRHYRGDRDVLVLALPRGGVPVAYEVARSLRAPLDVFQVRKLGVPGHEELAMGAISSGGVRVLNESVVRALNITQEQIDRVAAKEQLEMELRERQYRGDRPPPAIRGRKIILVDDGLATGASMRAAIAALRTQGPAEIVAAVPTAPPETCRSFESEVERIICAETPQPFKAVGFWYEDFSQTTDDEVREYLKRASEPSQADTEEV